VESQKTPISDLIKLTGKLAVITGGAMGIGLGIACRLAEAGATVLLADMNAESAAKASAELNDQEYKALSVKCDVSKENDVRNMFSTAVREMGGIDILVNNAGIYPRRPLIEMTGEEFEKVTSVNITGTFLCSKYAAAMMLEQKRGGCIINIASIEALHPSNTGMAAYDSSKGGVLMLTKSMARELGMHGIRVNAIAPGAIMTKGVTSQVGKNAQGQGQGSLKDLKAFMARMALGRMGDADDIARVALFLASDLASYVTGDLIVADGGYLVS
jgi:2-deoxy-D-gluconate 3-dehydrogenase